MKCFGKRRGHSLIELMMVISVAAVIMVVNVGWIHQSMKFASSMRQRQRHHQNLTRLAWALRDDVWQSDSMTMKGDGRLLLNWNDGTQVSYEITNTSLVVEKREELAEGPRIKNEVFELHPGSTIRWDTAELPNWISLVVFRENKGVSVLATEQAESSLPATDSVPIDFHLRVAPKRRALAVIGSDRTRTDGEDSK